MIPLLKPDWILPAGVQSFSTTRNGGVSQPPFNTLNLGDHVGDNPGLVLQNRQRLNRHLGLTQDIVWLEQVHGTDVLSLEPTRPNTCRADASYSRIPGQVCAIMTADCLPVLFCSVTGAEVAAAHAGWRGLQAGVLEKTVAHFIAKPAEIMAWLGPAIGPQQFEVGPEVRQAFIDIDPNAQRAFCDTGDKYLADIYTLARQRLYSMGVTQVYGGDYCTVSQPELFFSYRREKNTGRMASLIWFD